jgi:MoaA/NifB/PqqE/SkfB family radical SAM enzyme
VRQKLKTFTDHQLPADDPDYINLRARQFLLDAQNAIAPELLALKIRTKYHRLAEFTGLHIFVVTLRCAHSCPYCQVSRQSDDKIAFDMTPEIAEKAMDLVFRYMMVGIPLYSDDPVRHNSVVQSANAFNETVHGILNLKSLGQAVEIRVVIHKQTVDRLVQPLRRSCGFNGAGDLRVH